MKKTTKLLGITVFMAVIGLLIVACGDITDVGNNPSSPQAPQTLVYTGQNADGSIYTLKIIENTTARYVIKDGDSYELTITTKDGQTKTSKGTVKIEGETLALTPTEAENTFTITVTESGGITAISGTITFIDNETQTVDETELTPIAKSNWGSGSMTGSGYEDNTVTITNFYNDKEEKCTVIVGGKALTDPNKAWYAWVNYKYQGEKNKAYKYTFEAWTDSGDRTCGIEYWHAEDYSSNLTFNSIKMTTEHKTFTKVGYPLPTSGQNDFSFHCANQTGTFYIKMISIDETTEPVPDEERWSKNQYLDATLDYTVDNNGVCTINVSRPTVDNWTAEACYSYSAKAGKKYAYTFEAYKESDDCPDRYVNIMYYDNYNWDNDYIRITEIPTTFTLGGVVMPRDGIEKIRFQCGYQPGKFYIKIINIKEVKSNDPGYNFSFVEEAKGITIIKYKGDGRSVTIPDTINGKYVNSIGDNAFYCNTNITSVTFGKYVNSIGNGAFYECTSLTSVDIPPGASIGDWTFYGCTGLTSVTISFGVNRIGIYAFSGCSKLTEIIIPNSVTSIGDGAFYECTSLSSVTISDHVDLISYQTFYGCTSLASITIPTCITQIFAEAFYECTSLSCVTFQRNNYTAIYGDCFPGNLEEVSGGENAYRYGTWTTTNPGNESTWTKQ